MLNCLRYNQFTVVFYIVSSQRHGKSSSKIFCVSKSSPVYRETPFISWNFKYQLNKKIYKHDDVIKWKHFPRNWLFVWGIPVNSPHKGQWRGALVFSLICVWINDWVNTRAARDLRRYRVHYDVTVINMAADNLPMVRDRPQAALILTYLYAPAP